MANSGPARPAHPGEAGDGDDGPQSVGGLLILSRPVIVWNIVVVVINFWSVAVYFRFARRDENH